MVLILVQGVRDHDVPVYDIDNDREENEEADQSPGNVGVIVEEVKAWGLGAELDYEDYDDLEHEGED